MTWALILSDEDGERWNGPLTVAEVFRITTRAVLVRLSGDEFTTSPAVICAQRDAALGSLSDMRAARDAARTEAERQRASLRAVRDFNAVPIPGHKKEYGACDPTKMLIEREPSLFQWSHNCKVTLHRRDGGQYVEEFMCWLSFGERCPRCGQHAYRSDDSTATTEPVR